MGARGLPRAMWLGLALIVAPFLALIALQAYELIGRAPRLAHSRQLVVHALKVMDTAQRLERAVADAERSQRGYLLSGDLAYLQTYRTAASNASTLADRLTQFTGDDPEQRRRMPNLRLQVATRLGELEHGLAARDRDGAEAGREAARADRGVLNQTIAGLVDATVATEDALLRQRLEQVAEDTRRTATADLVTTVLAFAIMAMGVGVALVAFRRVRRAEAAHGLSEQRFRLLVDGVADHAIYTLDPEGNVADWNAGAERLKGYKAEEIVGQHFSRFYTAEDRQAGVPARALATALCEGKYEAEGWRVRKDGARFWASATISRLRDAAGRDVGFAKITRDVTRQREQQLALAEARAALAQSQKMDALGQLSGGIAHDFNNLLHVIANCAEVLERRLPAAGGDTRQLLDMVKRSAARGASLTQRMLAFSRRQPLQPRPSNPNRLVSGMADLLRRALGESIELETVLGSGVWSVSIDANQLEAALINLAVNARDAMPEGGKLTIETTNAFLDEAYAATNAEVKSGQYALIAVSDTGIGMTAEVRERAFDPFFTTKEPGQGTGLGLSQVYGFIKQSEGHVKIYSEPGEGTTVKLYLPRLVGAEIVEPAHESATAPRSTGAESILVVEDDEDVRTFTADVLRELGYRVAVAPDGQAALRMLEQSPHIDLVFTDVGLPNGMNGRQLANELRQRWPAVKVLFTTGYARNAIVHHGRLDPGVHLVVKPFTQAALADKVRSVLDGVPP